MVVFNHTFIFVTCLFVIEEIKLEVDQDFLYKVKSANILKMFSCLDELE